MNFIVKFFLLFGLTLFFGCSEAPNQNQFKNWMTPNGKIKVLSTIAMIDDLVKEIGGDYVDHHVLIKGDLDPHSYQLVKGDDEKIIFAHLIFYNGLGLEHGASLQRHLQMTPKSISVGDYILNENPDLIIKVDGQLDPHIWMDVSLWSKAIPVIVEALSKQDERHAEYFQNNGKALQKHLEELHGEIKQKLHAIPENKRYLVTSHDAFNYFTRAYLADNSEKEFQDWQKRFAAPEGLAPESQLSTTDIKNILNHLKLYQIKVIFPESNVSKDSLRKILDAGKKEGLSLTIATQVLYADAMGKPGSDGDSYEKMMRHNAGTIASYLNE